MQEQYLGRLTPDMNVCDIDGQKIGAVARVYRDELAAALEHAGGPVEAVQPSRSGIVEVKTGLLGLGEHLYIPLSAIDAVTDEGVFVAKKKDEVEQDWHHKPDYLDQLQSTLARQQVSR
jgi:hypothetical protein